MNLPSEEKKWFAIYSNPRSEKAVAKTLIGKGIEVYLPLQVVVKQWSDRKKKVEEPLFKSYLFVHINYEKEHSSILATHGVVKFVKIGKEPSCIRTTIIDAIKLSLTHYSDILTSSETFEPNQPVRIIGGPLKGMDGIIAEQFGSKYFAIHIEQLGTNLLLKIPAAYLQAI